MLFLGIAAVVIAAVAGLAAMIAFGTSAPPPPMTSISNPFTSVDFSDVPPITRIDARDGTPLAVRVWQAAGTSAEATRIVIAIHGSSAMGQSIHPLAKALRGAGITVYAPDIRGHGDSGPRGDIDYPTQIDDDLADLVSAVRHAHPKATLTLLGFSSGGGYALHVAALAMGKQFERAVLISPFLGPRAPTARGITNDWVRPFIPRIIGISILGSVGIHAFDSLPAIAFAIRPDDVRRLTGFYSFRLMQAFGTLDYAADLRNAQCPVTVLIGGADELFIADQFAPAVHKERPEAPVTIVPDLGHIPMITDARSYPAVIAAVKGN